MKTYTSPQEFYENPEQFLKQRRKTTIARDVQKQTQKEWDKPITLRDTLECLEPFFP